MKNLLTVSLIGLCLFLNAPERGYSADPGVESKPPVSVSAEIEAGSGAFVRPTEKEYYGQVLLIDHKTGEFGILSELDDDKTEKKYFKAAPDGVDISNNRNEEIFFRQIQTGHYIEVYTVTGPDGVEAVTEIYDNEAFEEE